jgi:hypothetical protein
MSDLSNSASKDRSLPGDFAHHHDYSALMLGARRKAAPHIGAPAITRHLGFWIPDKLTLERKKWIGRIEVSFVELYRQLAKLTDKVTEVSTSNLQKSHDSKSRLYLIYHSYNIEEGGGPQPIEGAEEQSSRHQRFLLSFVWQTMPVGITLELFDEYFTLSTVIDLSRRSAASDTELGKAIEAFNCLAFKRYDGKGDGDDSAAKALQGREFAGAFDVIYNTVWDELHEDIFAAPFASHSETLGKVFAEFRAFVACRQGTKFIATDGKVEPQLENEIGTERFSGKNAIRCVDAIRPFMAADAWLNRDEDDERSAEPREFTFTPVLNGRYIYASALGAPPFDSQDGRTRLTYMLLAANQCPSELGLLVDGFHVLGCTRLAALYDFPHLTHAALELRELERDINMLQSDMLGANTPEKAAKLSHDLPEFSSRLTEIEQGIKREDTTKDPQIVGGLSFRVERSHYYQRQFLGMVKGLRIGRIQGFLTYDEAVARRLGGIYDLINTVGHRHERLREILNGLGRRLQTSRTHELQQKIEEATRNILELHGQITTLTRNIDRTQDEVADEQKVLEGLQIQGINLLRNSQETQTEVMRIQLIGEALLTIFLVPYYVVSLLSHGLSCQLDEWCAKRIVQSICGIDINMETAGTAAVFVLCAMIGFVRVVVNLNKIRTTKKSRAV